MSVCARCGAAFACAMADAANAEPCWCTLEPAGFPVPDAGAVAAGASCWCPACLRQRKAEARAGMALPTPAPN